MGTPEAGEGSPSSAPDVNGLAHLSATPTQSSMTSDTACPISRSHHAHQLARAAKSTSQDAQLITEMPLAKDDGAEAART